jgi:putative two-component system response regulator
MNEDWHEEHRDRVVDRQARVLVADDVPANVEAIARILSRDGHRVFRASSGNETLTLVEQARPDLVLLDVMMPERDGFELCALLKGDPATRLIPVVLVTALQDTNAKIRGLNAGADDFVTKPVNPAELQARVRSLLRLKRYTDELDSAVATFLTLAMTIEARDPGTEGHCQRLSRYAVDLGRALGLADDDLETLRRGGVLHDIGKVAVPDTILLKPGPLSHDEVLVMQQHTIVGERLCSELRSLRHVRPIVRHHHERLDGSGYPDGLQGDAIPLLAQVMAIVDVYDALTSDRPYRAAVSPERAFAELQQEADRGWKRRDLVGVFIATTQQRKTTVVSR